jgi:hypothetical protein
MPFFKNFFIFLIKFFIFLFFFTPNLILNKSTTLTSCPDFFNADTAVSLNLLIKK